MSNDNIALRSRNRKLWFCSKNFDELANEVDRPHRFGPFAGKALIEAVSEIAGLLQAPLGLRLDDEFCGKILCVPLTRGPDVDSFRSGFGIFMEKHDACFTDMPLSRAVSILGCRLWREHLAHIEILRQEEDHPISHVVGEEILEGGDVANENEDDSELVQATTL